MYSHWFDIHAFQGIWWNPKDKFAYKKNMHFQMIFYSLSTAIVACFEIYTVYSRPPESTGFGILSDMKKGKKLPRPQILGVVNFRESAWIPTYKRQ